MKVYVELDKDEKKLFKKIEKITFTDYEIKDDKIEVESLLNTIKDLYVYHERLEEEFEDYKDYVKDNYKYVPQEEQYM